MFVMFCPAAFAATLPCPEPGKIIYPMDEILIGEARVLGVVGSMKIEAVPETFDVSLSPDRLRQEVFAALEGKSEAEQDALLLARFAVYAGFNNAAVIFTALREAGLLETYLDLLDRRELSKAANALRAAGSAYAPENLSPEARYSQWSDGRGTILDPVLDTALKTVSKRLNQQSGSIRAKALEVLEGSEAYPAYQKKREALSDDDRLYYLFEPLRVYRRWFGSDITLHFGFVSRLHRSSPLLHVG